MPLAGAIAPREQLGAGNRLGRDLGLHVERAAAPQVAVGEVARPRVVLPLGRVGEHRVDVAEVDERRPVAVGAASVATRFGRALVAASSSRLETGSLEVAGEVLDRGALVAGRIDGVEAHEALQDVGRLLLEVGAAPSVA